MLEISVVIFSVGVVFSGDIKRQMRCCLSCSLRVSKEGYITLLNLLLFFPTLRTSDV